MRWPEWAGKPGSVSLSLDRYDRPGNVHLKISDISKRLVVNIPDALVDLLEIACYIYAADSAISRGGPPTNRWVCAGGESFDS